MKRWNVYLQDNKVLKLYYNNIDEIKKHYKNVLKIERNNDISHFKYCEQIINNSDEILKDYRGRDIYKIIKPFGYIYVRLAYDTNDDTWYDYCTYQVHCNKAQICPCLFTVSNPKDFCEKFLFEDLEYQVISFRKWGEPKLIKPTILKGIKGFSIDWIPKKCTCQYFIKDNDIYIKHRDYFSPSYCRPEDIGTPLSYRIKKYNIKSGYKDNFIYPDSWGDIILRQEAWLQIKNVIPLLNIFNYNQVSKMIVDKMEQYLKFSLDLEWERFYEKICKNVQSTLI